MSPTISAGTFDTTHLIGAFHWESPLPCMCTRMTSQHLDAMEADLAAIKLARVTWVLYFNPIFQAWLPHLLHQWSLEVCLTLCVLFVLRSCDDLELCVRGSRWDRFDPSTISLGAFACYLYCHDHSFDYELNFYLLKIKLFFHKHQFHVRLHAIFLQGVRVLGYLFWTISNN